MDRELDLFKLALRNLDYKNVSSNINEEINIRFTYKNRNYLLHINTSYKIVIVEQIDSIKVGEFNKNDLELLNDLDAIIEYTSFEGYQIMYMSCCIDEILKKIEIANIKKYYLLSITKLNLDSEYKQGIIINKDKGLYNFDHRLFEHNWNEDFNSKIETYTEEDIFLMISTFSSYYYKVYADKWNGEKIDPFVINYFSELLVEYSKKYESDFEKWYAFWDEYFTKEEIEKYLNDRDKSKTKYKK